MNNRINYQTGVFKTVATYQTTTSTQESINSLCNAIRRCNYKIIQQTPNMVKFKTPVTFTDWGFKLIAVFNQNGRGSSVQIEGKYVLPIYFDIFGGCKKKISKLEPFL